nr:IS66 family transposase [Acidocella sp. MX-AZ02]
MAIDLENLPDDAGTLRELVTNAALENAGLRAEIDKLHIMIKGLQRHRFGKRSEQLDAAQMQLVMEDLEQTMGAGAAAGEARAEAEMQTGQKSSTKPVRRQRNLGQLPAELPRYEVVIDLADTSCPCCRGELQRVGESRAEMLDILPAQLRVKVICRPRYICQACDTPIVQAPAPPRPIDGGMATEALISHVLVSKFADHLPLYRQAQIFERQGITLDRSTLGDWIGRACWWLRPVYDRLVGHIMAAEKIFADDTGLPVLDPGRGRTKTGRFWCYAVDDRPWCGPAPPAAAYVYAEDRKGMRPTAHLANFRGIVQVDGYAGFGQVVKARADASVKLAFCWVHARRGFFEVHASTKSPIAAEALARIAALYEIEAEIRNQPATHRQAVRQARSRPLVEALHDWLDQQLPRISKATKLAEAIRYALRHWEGLIRFLDDGRLELDTNTVEREIRPITLGRKNALFAGNDSGAEHWAICASLIASAKLNGLNPFAYLTDVLERIVAGRTKITEIEALLPWNWRPTGMAELPAAA